jgi:hypothetical protein
MPVLSTLGAINNPYSDLLKKDASDSRIFDSALYPPVPQSWLDVRTLYTYTTDGRIKTIAYNPWEFFSNCL